MTDDGEAALPSPPTVEQLQVELAKLMREKLEYEEAFNKQMNNVRLLSQANEGYRSELAHQQAHLDTMEKLVEATQKQESTVQQQLADCKTQLAAITEKHEQLHAALCVIKNALK